MSAAFYCVSDSKYFLGAAALINSLRGIGHTEPIFLLDCGLDPHQRELLDSSVNVIDSPGDAAPTMLKTIAPLAHPADVMVLLDTDIVVNRSLADLIERAAEGFAIGFENPMDRFVPEWGELLDLGTVRRQAYVSGGALIVNRAMGETILSLLEDRQHAVDFERTFWVDNVAGYPFLYPDQDVLNAILASRVPEERFVALDRRLAATPPYAGLRIVDGPLPRCRYDDGAEPYLVHQYLPPKPWISPAYDGVYSRLLRRWLARRGLAVDVDPRTLPLRLRTGVLAYVAQRGIDARQQLRWRLGRSAG